MGIPCKSGLDARLGVEDASFGLIWGIQDGKPIFLPAKVSVRSVRKEISIQNTGASAVWIFSTNRVATIAIDEETILLR